MCYNKVNLVVGSSIRVSQCSSSGGGKGLNPGLTVAVARRASELHFLGLLDLLHDRPAVPKGRDDPSGNTPMVV